MKNLIKNSHWCPSEMGGPMYFSGNGSTYDKLLVDGFRTCSITRSAMTMDITSDNYDLPISVDCKDCLCFGYYLRAAEADHIILTVQFFNKDQELIKISTCDIADCVTCSFTKQFRKFKVPKGACYAKVSMMFDGTVTACTYFAPTAYYC